MADASDRPRVLILGPTFDTVTGGGITLTNLFRGWPADRLALACFDPCLVEPPPAAYQYRLGSDERRWVPPLRFAGAWDEGSGAGADASGMRSAGAAGGGDGQGRGLRPQAKRAFHGLARLLGSDEYLRPLAVSDPLVSWAKAFRPDLLYTQLGTWGMTRLTLDLAAALRVPVAVHMMDDWPEVIYRHGLVGPRLRRRLDRDLRTLLGAATARMAISDAMAREYAARYGGEWSYFHNPVEPERWRRAPTAAPAPATAASGPPGGGVAGAGSPAEGTSPSAARPPEASGGRDFILVYSGRIGPGIESSVLDICRAVAGLRHGGRRVRLEIHSIHFDRKADPRFAAFDGVGLHGAIPDADMAATLGAADVLVLPFDFHGDAVAFARLSFPTKAPAYEGTGVPILVYAPAGHAVTADAAARGWGYVVGEPDRDVLAAAISRLMDDAELRSRLSVRALEDVAARHEAGAVRERFAAVLAAAARGGRGTG